MLSAAGAAAPHLELAVILWSVFTALRTFTNAQSFVKLIVSGPKAAECEEDVAQRVVRRFFQLNPNLRPAGHRQKRQSSTTLLLEDMDPSRGAPEHTNLSTGS